MNAKFVKKLKEEIKKSPAKAAVLALLLLVAIWFWAPLALNLFGGESPKTTASTANATTGSAAKDVVATPAVPSPAPPAGWQSVANSIDLDARMKVTENVKFARDPFQAKEPEKPKDEHETKPIELPPVVKDVLPGEAGLVLTSTVVGPNRRVARVNGKSYQPGATIVASVGVDELEYRVVAVDGRSITLALGEKQYELKLPRRQSGTGVSAAVSVSSDSPDFDPSLLEE